jgi:hypothetical protein
MSNTMTAAIAWLGLVLHLAAGIAASRSRHALLILGAVNLLTALGVLAYWGVRWYGYLFRAISWSATDQLFPLYALVVAVLAALVLTGRLSSPLPLWIVFSLDALVFLAAALFLTFFRMTRLF